MSSDEQRSGHQGVWTESWSVFQDYYKALEDADEKVQLANQIYDLVSLNEPHRNRVPTHPGNSVTCDTHQHLQDISKKHLVEL